MHNFSGYQYNGFTKSLSNTSNKQFRLLKKMDLKTKLLKSSKTKFKNIYRYLSDLNLLLFSYEEMLNKPQNIFFNKDFKQNIINIKWLSYLSNNIKKETYAFFSNVCILEKKHDNFHCIKLQGFVIELLIKKILYGVHAIFLKKISEDLLIIKNINLELKKITLLFANYLYVVSVNFSILIKEKTFINLIKANILNFKFNKILLKFLKSINNLQTNFFIKKNNSLYKVILNIYLTKLDLYLMTFLKEYNITLPSIKKFKRFEVFILKSTKASHFLLKKTRFALKLNFYKIKFRQPHFFFLVSFHILYIRFLKNVLFGLNGNRAIIIFVKNKFEFFLKANLHFSTIKTKLCFQETIFAGFFFFKSFYSHRPKPFNHRSIKNINLIKQKYTINVYLCLQKLKILLEKYGVLNKKLNPAPILYLTFIYSDSIIIWFNFLFFGLLKYYKNCNNYKELAICIFFILKWSLLFTLSKKHKKSLKIIFQKYFKSSLLINSNNKTLSLLHAPFLYNIKILKKPFFIEYIYKKQQFLQRI
jgi:hypothetical protein